MILRVLLYAFLIYLLYKLVFDLIIPVYTATKKIKKGFGEMHSRMQEEMNKQSSEPSQPQPAGPTKPASPKKASDYIDFEEIK
jgi:hypothetical protein